MNIKHPFPWFQVILGVFIATRVGVLEVRIRGSIRTEQTVVGGVMIEGWVLFGKMDMDVTIVGMICTVIIYIRMRDC